MKKTFSGWLYNRIEELGGKPFNHIGCRGKDEKFIDFLTHFVPKIGMQRKVKFTVETQKEPKIIESYKVAKNYKDEYGEKIKISEREQQPQPQSQPQYPPPGFGRGFSLGSRRGVGRSRRGTRGKGRRNW